MQSKGAEEIQPTMRLLGYGGLLPFAALLTTAHLAGPDLAAWATASLLHYAAVILTFVGAVHWGYLLRDATTINNPTQRLGWAIIPSVVGWVALSLPYKPAATVMALAFVVCWWIDRNHYRFADIDWYHTMRSHLTAGVVCSLAGLLIL